MRKALTALVLVGATGLLPAWPATATATPSSLTGLSAASILDLSLASAHDEGSCTDAARGAAVGYTFGSTTDSGATQARERVYFNTSGGHVLFVRGVVYVNESAPLISLQFGKNVPAWANRWVSIPASSRDFRSFSAGMLFSSMITQLRPAGALRTSLVQTISGQRVVGVAGAANAQLGLTGGSETLFVATRAPFLPVELRASGRTQGVPTTLTVTFSHWGEHVVVSIPRPVTPIARTTLP